MTELRYDWTVEEILKLFETPFLELVFRAQQIHRENFKANEVQISSLLSIKTGSCPEDCKYCPQSAHNKTDVEKEKLLEMDIIKAKAAEALQSGATRFCMGAAWRNPKDSDMPYLKEIIKTVKGMGLETCMTLGMLTPQQAEELKDAGLDYYNHNIQSGILRPDHNHQNIQ